MSSMTAVAQGLFDHLTEQEEKQDSVKDAAITSPTGQAALAATIAFISLLVKLLLLTKLGGASPKVQLDAQAVVDAITTLGTDVATGA